tara:strand:- start:779 stop:1042 length:264 start_codon:yes stop_codon:yes gene_type:complete
MLLQRIIHFLGHSTGFLLGVFKSPHKKQKLSPTSSEESNRMSRRTPSQDSNSDLIGDWNDYALGLYMEAQKINAKKIDDYIFQDYEE